MECVKRRAELCVEKNEQKPQWMNTRQLQKNNNNKCKEVLKTRYYSERTLIIDKYYMIYGQ